MFDVMHDIDFCKFQEPAKRFSSNKWKTTDGSNSRKKYIETFNKTPTAKSAKWLAPL